MHAEPILVVDRHADARRQIRRSLSAQGFETEVVENAAKVNAMLGDLPYGLVILDDDTGQKGGGTILANLVAEQPDVPVIVMAEGGSVARAVAAMQAGAADYLMKPIAPEALVAAVSNTLSRSAGDAATQRRRPSPAPKPRDQDVITDDANMRKVLKMARTVAASRATVLIQGESGTGKEVLARYIHQHCGRETSPYVAMNCAALPEHLAESELFGHEKGAFTGAVSRKAGKFELADGGTLVLDEISEMPLPLQAKLLRVLQQREVDRVGGRLPVPVDVRTIAISNVDLKQAVTEGRFREDLFYRINVIPLTIPALRERRRDIPLLAEYFLAEYCRRNQKQEVGLAPETQRRLLELDWKGNVRELENTMERAVLLCTGDQIRIEDLLIDPDPLGGHSSLALKVGTSVREMEKELIFKTLAEVNDNRTHAAKMLGISIRTLRNKLSEYRQEKEAVA
jgi:DNA-binding NtrC family response regulator